MESASSATHLPLPVQTKFSPCRPDQSAVSRGRTAAAGMKTFFFFPSQGSPVARGVALVARAIRMVGSYTRRARLAAARVAKPSPRQITGRGIDATTRGARKPCDAQGRGLVAELGDVDTSGKTPSRSEDATTFTDS